jgi:hypothetical protein
MIDGGLVNQNNPSDGSFDLVVAQDVFEHLFNPMEREEPVPASLVCNDYP